MGKRKTRAKQKGGCECKRKVVQRGGGKTTDYIYENRYKIAAGIGAGAYLGLGIAGNMMKPSARVYTDPYGGTLLAF
jgi:hypothetical protein